MNDLNVTIIPKPSEIPPVHDYDVPLLLVNIDLFSAQDCDLTLSKLVPFLNGVNYVQKAAELAEINIENARTCVECLLRSGVVVLIDIFQYSNSYCVQNGVLNLANDVEMQQNCLTFVTRPGIVFFEFLSYVYASNGVRIYSTFNQNHTRTICCDKTGS